MDQVTFARYSGETARIIFAPLFIGLARDYFKELDISIAIVEPEEQPWVTDSLKPHSRIWANIVRSVVTPA